MVEYLKCLSEKYKANANSENALPMKKYMRNQFEFFGIKNPERKIIDKQFFAENGLPEISDLEKIIKSAWNLPEREFQYFAMFLLDKMKKQFDEKVLNLLEYFTLEKSWWDSVDFLSANMFGYMFQRFPVLIPEYTENWMASENMWLQRTSILFQLKYKEATDLELLSNFIHQLSSSKEFFIQKAIGWELREYSKTNPQWVIDFVENNKLASLSKREALKVINRNKK